MSVFLGTVHTAAFEALVNFLFGSNLCCVLSFRSTFSKNFYFFNTSDISLVPFITSRSVGNPYSFCRGVVIAFTGYNPGTPSHYFLTGCNHCVVAVRRDVQAWRNGQLGDSGMASSTPDCAVAHIAYCATWYYYY